MTQPLVIYHGNCPDGFTAAWVAARALGDTDQYAAKYGEPPLQEVELYAGKYGEPPPFGAATGRDVYIVDFSYPREQLVLLKDFAKSLLVLDHHKTAQEDLMGGEQVTEVDGAPVTVVVPPLPYCTFDMNRSGAGLTWDHFHPGEPRPWVVDYVEDRDLWRFRLPHSEELSLFIRLQPHTLEAYDALLKLPIESALVEAAGAKKYLDHYVRDALRNAYDLPSLHEDETVRCVNVSYTGISDVLNAALSSGEVRCALGWHMSKSDTPGERAKLACSLRSAKGYDCTPFARAHGGGGHAQAAGFRLELDSPLAQRLMHAT